MGQMVAVTEKPSSSRGVVRFELNRSLTGMGHEHFAGPEDAYGNSPADVLARRLFATGQVAAVHVYANIVTVDLRKGYGSEGLADIVAHDLLVTASKLSEKFGLAEQRRGGFFGETLRRPDMDANQCCARPHRKASCPAHHRLGSLGAGYGHHDPLLRLPWIRDAMEASIRGYRLVDSIGCP